MPDTVTHKWSFFTNHARVLILSLIHI